MAFIIEYIWLDGSDRTRSKTRVLKKLSHSRPFGITDVPEWNYDGSSTGQANSDGNTEIILKPVMLYKDPFYRDDKHWLVLCDSDKRREAMKLFVEGLFEEPWFGLEQEYFIFHKDFNINLIDKRQGNYYCGVGPNAGRKFYERIIANEHLDSCLYAGINIAGINAEVACNQWEFQVGICEGISAGDELHMARYILERIAEKYDCIIDYRPKLDDTMNGSGCHVNFSTLKTRSANGLYVILDDYITRLNDGHIEDILYMGKDNERRLTGKHETSNMNTFTFGIGTRNTSIRIVKETQQNGYGYFEDRRPAANMEPYTVTSLIFKRCCL
jgi:glutamine synthetase